MEFKAVHDELAKLYKANELRDFERAYKFAKDAHKGQKRKSGEDYINHPLQVAHYLGTTLRMDINTLIAGLLHDVPEETPRSLEDIKKEFGEEVEFLVRGITKLGQIKLRNQKDENYIETLRTMFLAMAEDIRVVLIKLADRQNNMTTLEHLPPDKQLRIARETLEIYAPIAHRLGMGELKGELEDLSFPFVEKTEYEWLAGQVKERYDEMSKYIKRACAVLKKDLEDAKVKVEKVDGRAKHMYSLYHKLLRPKYDRDVSKIYDLVALRIITNNIEDCYAALGIIHSRYRPLPGKIKDYIAFPKPNGYRSIHTTVFGPEKRVLEMQIRTEEMHREAEFGIAAHWAYTEHGKPDSGTSASHEQLEWVGQLREWQSEVGGDSKEFIESLKIDFFKNRIFIFTPKGEVKNLPEGATSLDFAFMVHTDIGLSATGAKINGKMGKLSDELHNGDVVEILHAKEPRVSRDWLRFVKTSTARSSIRAHLNKNQKGWLSGILPDFLKRN